MGPQTKRPFASRTGKNSTGGGAGGGTSGGGRIKGSGSHYNKNTSDVHYNNNNNNSYYNNTGGATGANDSHPKLDSSSTSDRHSKHSNNYVPSADHSNSHHHRRGGGSSGLKKSMKGPRNHSANSSTSGGTNGHSNNSNSNNGTNGADGNANSTNSMQSRQRRKVLDPTLLARGMSARAIGARVSSSSNNNNNGTNASSTKMQIKALSKDDVERDIRHMEAYGAACIAYAQQFFIYTNRDLVQKGHFGPVPPRPIAGISQTEVGYANATAANNNANGVSNNSNGNDPKNSAIPGGGISMPIRIDPEEEKRLALLRKRVAASEAKREVLETEYLSLRAHYVHESHRFRRMRKTVTGTLNFLKELSKRRGLVLALHRVRCAMARDVLNCLEYRAKAMAIQKDEGDVGNSSTSLESNEVTPMEGVEEASSKAGDTATATASDKNEGNDDTKMTEVDSKEDQEIEASDLPDDLIDIWTDIEARLQEAERACAELKTPTELIQVKHLSSQAAETAAELRIPFDSLSGKSAADGEDAGNGSTSSGKKKGGKNSSNNDGSKGNAGGKGSKYQKKSSGEDSNNSAFDTSGGKEEDDNVIPWTCQVMPRTPYDVSVFISNLSSTPDWSAAFATGGIFGSKETSMLWLESNIPKTFAPQMHEENKDLLRLREEARLLTEELHNDIQASNELQKDLNANRKRSDELAVTMSMLRTETEAVLDRHNIILDTPEAKEQASALHAQHMEESEFAEEEDLEEDGTLEEEGEIGDLDEEEEGEEGDDDDDDDGGTVIEEDEDGELNGDNVDQNPFGLSVATSNVTDNDINTAIESDSAEEGEIQEEVDEPNGGGNDRISEEVEGDNKHPMREVIVPIMDSGGHGTGEAPDGSHNSASHNESKASSEIDNSGGFHKQNLSGGPLLNNEDESGQATSFIARMKRGFTESGAEAPTSSDDMRSQKRRRGESS